MPKCCGHSTSRTGLTISPERIFASIVDLIAILCGRKIIDSDQNKQKNAARRKLAEIDKGSTRFTESKMLKKDEEKSAAFSASQVLADFEHAKNYSCK